MLSGIELSIPALFLAGLQSSPHCAVMCSGLSSQVSQQWPRWLSAQFMRALSYSLLGALAGSFGAYVLLRIPAGLSTSAWRSIMGLALIGLGVLIYLRRHKTQCPKATRRQRPWLALSWGLMPCPALYAALTVALFSGHPWNGFLLMLAFALGTLPMHGVQALGWRHLKPLSSGAQRVSWRAGLVAANGSIILLSSLFLPTHSALFCLPG